MDNILDPRILDRAAILAAQDLPTKTVDVPEWGGQVIVKTMTGTERDLYEALEWANRRNKDLNDPQRLVNTRARLVAMTAVDADGNLLFTPADVADLGRKNGAALDRVYDAALDLNGLSVKAVETIKGN